MRKHICKTFPEPTVAIHSARSSPGMGAPGPVCREVAGISLDCPPFTRNAWEMPPDPTPALSCLSEEQEDLGGILTLCPGAERGEAVGETEISQKLHA